MQAPGAAQPDAALEPDLFWDTVLSTSAVGILTYRADGACVWANDAAARIVGATREYLLSQNFREIRSWKDSRLLELALGVLEDGREVLHEADILTSTGKRAWFEVRFSRFVSGSEPHLMMVFSDISQRKQAEAELRASHERLEAMVRKRTAQVEDLSRRLATFVESSDALFTEVDCEGRFLYVNGASNRIFGLPREECLGLSAFEFIHPDDRDVTRAAFEGWVRSRALSVSIENRQVSRQGEVHHMLWTISPQYEPDGRLRSIWSVARDISELKQVEAALKAAIAELDRSNRDLEQFAYVASHDLQEPLRMVSGFTQLLAVHYRDKLEGDGLDFIQYAVDGANRMQRLIQDLLAYSRIGSRGQPLKAVGAEQCLDAALRNLHTALDESGATITRDPMPRVKADATQLTQLFQNLVANSLKFRGAAAPQVHVTADEQPDCHVFSLRDNGIGIEPRFYERIFVIFQRLHPKKKYPGSGVGLAICKRIVERHGGRIWVESSPGQGATFRFSIPKETRP